MAVDVTIGDNTGTNVTVSDLVKSVACTYGGTETRVTMTTVNGDLYTAIYKTASNTDYAWCSDKINNVAAKLVENGLASSYDLSESNRDSGHNYVSLLLSNDGSAEGDSGDPDGGGGGGGSTTVDLGDVNSECTSILPGDWCEGDGSAGISGILNLVLNIMTMGVGILATVGLIISGIQWLTARDNENQVIKAKSRIFNIVIGIALWGVMYMLLAWLTPGGLEEIFR